jgi:hypothetical protein
MLRRSPGRFLTAFGMTRAATLLPYRRTAYSNDTGSRSITTRVFPSRLSRRAA